jgi:hypothetical protein
MQKVAVIYEESIPKCFYYNYDKSRFPSTYELMKAVIKSMELLGFNKI